MDENIAAVLSYAGGWVTGLIFLFTDKRPKVRFQAAQSVIVFGALNVISIVFRIVAPSPIVDALWLITIAAWAFLMYKAYQGADFKVPLAAELVEPLLKKSATLTGDEEPQAAAPKDFNPNEPPLAQIVKHFDSWTPDDAAKALGAPAREFDLMDGAKGYTYFYTSGSNDRIEIDLGFTTPAKRMGVVMLTPFDLLFDAIRPNLHGQPQVLEGENGVRTYHFNNLHVACVVDQAGKIFKIVVDQTTSPQLLEWLSSVSSVKISGTAKAGAPASPTTGAAQKLPDRGPQPFNPTQPALPQVVKQVGFWTSDDAAKALGAPAKEFPMPDGSSIKSYNLPAANPGEALQIDLAFAAQTHRLTFVMLHPYNLLFDAIRPKLDGQPVITDNANGSRTIQFPTLNVAFVVDPAGKVFSIGVFPQTNAEMLEWLSSVASFAKPSASAASPA